jgi:hypothetical protein
MITRTARSTAAAAGAALALLLAGCGGGGGTTDPGEQKGAIDLLFEDMYGEWDPEQSNQEMIRIEEITAECMAEEGFDYTPVDYTQGGGAMPIEDDGIEEEWGTLEFAKKWGYGATTNPWGETEPEPVDPGQEWIDPNAEYIESMTEAEQTAYYTALYGEQWNQEWTEEMESEEYVWDWTTAGCSGQAQHEVYGDSMGGTPDGDFTDLEAEMQVMWESISSDPRLAEVTGEWATCMAGVGYPGLSDVSDAENLIYEQVNALWEDAYADIPPDAGEEAWRAVEESIQEELTAITPEEIKTAVADYTCRDEVGYARTQAEVNVAHQQEFYDLHKDELIAWAETMSGK